MAYHGYKHKSGGYFRHRSRGGRYATYPGCLIMIILILIVIIATGLFIKL